MIGVGFEIFEVSGWCGLNSQSKIGFACEVGKAHGPPRFLPRLLGSWAGRAGVPNPASLGG